MREYIINRNHVDYQNMLVPSPGSIVIYFPVSYKQQFLNGLRNGNPYKVRFDEKSPNLVEEIITKLAPYSVCESKDFFVGHETFIVLPIYYRWTSRGYIKMEQFPEKVTMRETKLNPFDRYTFGLLSIKSKMIVKLPLNTALVRVYDPGYDK